MTRYEYKVLPAPFRGVKAKGAKTTEARFAHALMEVMNELGQDGWEYQRTDTLPCEERVGLTGRATRFQNMLVFRRALAVVEEVSVEAATFRRNGSPTPQIAAAAQPAPPSDDAEIEDETVAASDTASDTYAAEDDTESGEETRESVADRLAATLSIADRPAKSPALMPTGEAGNAPKLGAATGNGLTQNSRPS